MAETFDFDVMADRSVDHARKWDAQIIEQKYPGTPRFYDAVISWQRRRHHH